VAWLSRRCEASPTHHEGMLATRSTHPHTPVYLEARKRGFGVKRSVSACSCGPGFRVMAETDGKRCSRCGETGLPDRFPPNSRMRDGLSSWCRRCHAAAVQRWR
jgi:hypothetical protein